MSPKACDPSKSARLVSPGGLVHFVWRSGDFCNPMKITWCEIVGDGEKSIDFWAHEELRHTRKNARVTCLQCVATQDRPPSDG